MNNELFFQTINLSMCTLYAAKTYKGVPVHVSSTIMSKVFAWILFYCHRY